MDYASLDSARGRTAVDQFYLMDAWAAREHLITERLLQSLSDDPEGTSAVQHAILFADEVPNGSVTGTVFCREHNWWTPEDSYIAMGIVLRSADIPDEPPAYVELCAPAGNGEFAPFPDVDPRCANLVGSLATSRITWAALRGLEVTPDTTQLVLPDLTVIQAVRSTAI